MMTKTALAKRRPILVSVDFSRKSVTRNDQKLSSIIMNRFAKAVVAAMTLVWWKRLLNA